MGPMAQGEHRARVAEDQHAGGVKPEAKYFSSKAGRRTAMPVFDMEGSWQLPSLAGPLFENLNASVQVTPVTTIEDLQRGMAEAAAK